MAKRQKAVRVGSQVLYRLTAADAEQINRRRITGPEIAERLQTGTWPRGAQAHVGSLAVAGDVVPMVVTRTFEVSGSDAPTVVSVNGQATLDGTDTFWVQDAKPGDTDGTYAVSR